jgi:uncharacterized protein YneF (UPF0154 family)
MLSASLSFIVIVALVALLAGIIVGVIISRPNIR